MKRSSLVFLGVTAAILALSAWLFLQTRHALPNDLLSAIPADAYGVAGIRLRSVLESPAFKRLVVERGEAAGIERLTRTCGFNPLEGIEELVVFARPSADRSEPRFTFIARGPLKHEQLIDCVRKATGKAGEQLERESYEGIPMVRSKSGTIRAAFVGRNGLVGGDAEGVKLALEAMLGKAHSLALDPKLAELYYAPAEHTELRVVTRVPEAVLTRLQGLPLLKKDALAALSALEIFSAHAELDKMAIRGSTVFLTQTPEAAAQLVELTEQVRSRLLDLPGIGLMGLRAPLQSVKAETNGTRTTIQGALSLDAADTLLDLLPAIRRFKADLADPLHDAPRAASDAGAIEDASRSVHDGEPDSRQSVDAGR